MIIPHSAYCTDRMAPLQLLFQHHKYAAWMQTYAMSPSKLFIGADQRLAIYILQQSSKASNLLYTSGYNRWNEIFREYLFSVAEYAEVTHISFQNSVPKVHSELEQNVWKKLSQFLALGKHLDTKRAPYTAYYHNAARYWIRAMNFVPYFWNERDGEKISTHIKPLYFRTELEASVATATLNSSLFYWWFVLLSNCRDLTLREVRSFPMGIAQMEQQTKQSLSQLCKDLMVDLKHHAKRKKASYKTTGQVIYDEFYPRHSKHIIDEIDRVLAKHYGFSDEELDFIINYDIKYRVGLRD